jgi:hypothetical protein
VTNDDVEDGFAILTSSTMGSGVIAYASVVDNATGDPVYVPATAVVPQPFETALDPHATMFLLFRGLDVVDIESLVELLQVVGLEAALGGVAVAFPGIVTVGPSSIAMDFGPGYRLEDGTLLSGRLAVSVADVVIDPSTISGRPSFVFEDFRWNGQAPPVDTIFSTWDLAVDAEGHVTGTTSFTGTGTVPAKSIPVSLDGNAIWNTLLCLHYPVGGSFTLEIGEQSYTFTFNPDCDGDFDYSEGTPGWDWTYAFGNPGDAHAQQYLAGVENAEVWYEAPVYFWKPEVGGETFGETAPGVVTFRFPFDQPVSEAHLRLNMPTFHWTYSRGHNFLYASADGVVWELLMEVAPPEYGMANGGVYNADLPASLMGADELWLRAELYSYGERAPQGGVFTNTAQLARWDENNPGTTFQLDVRFED